SAAEAEGHARASSEHPTTKAAGEAAHNRPEDHIPDAIHGHVQCLLGDLVERVHPGIAKGLPKAFAFLEAALEVVEKAGEHVLAEVVEFGDAAGGFLYGRHLGSKAHKLIAHRGRELDVVVCSFV